MREREREPKDFESLLSWQKWSLAALVAAAGFLVYFVTLHQEGIINDFAHHVGLFLAAVVAVHFIYDVLVKRYERRAVRDDISEAINSTVESLLPAFRRWGFFGFSESLEIPKLFRRLEPGDELLWLDTYAPSRHIIVPELKDALNRGARVRMLAISSESVTARYRSEEITIEGFTERDFLGDLELFVGAMLNAANSSRFPDAFELRFYEDLPCVPMYLQSRHGVPIEGLTGFFLNTPSEYAAHMRWTFVDGGMLQHFKAYFDNKWDRAQPIAVNRTGVIRMIRE